MDNKNYAYASNNKGLVYMLLGRYMQIENKDPEELIQKAVKHFHDSLKLNPEFLVMVMLILDQL